MGVIVKEWSIVGSRGNTYRVTKDSLGDMECTCPDYYYRRRFKGGNCKHINKVIEQEGEGGPSRTFDEMAKSMIAAR